MCVVALFGACFLVTVYSSLVALWSARWLKSYILWCRNDAKPLEMVTNTTILCASKHVFLLQKVFKQFIFTKLFPYTSLPI